MATPKSPGDMVAAVLANLKEKTGKTLDEWIKIARTSKLTNARELRSWLKSEQGLGHVTAGIVADNALGIGRFAAYDNPDALLDALYSGPNEHLRPLYERLVEMGKKLGNDVRVVVCKTYVGLSRDRQFAILKPMAKNRIDVGLALPGVQPEGRLESSKATGSDRITHRVKVSAVKEIDAELKGWLRKAYEEGAK